MWIQIETFGDYRNEKMLIRTEEVEKVLEDPNDEERCFVFVYEEEEPIIVLEPYMEFKERFMKLDHFSTYGIGEVVEKEDEEEGNEE